MKCEVCTIQVAPGLSYSVPVSYSGVQPYPQGTLIPKPGAGVLHRRPFNALRLDIQQSLRPTIAGTVRKAGLAAAVVADGPDAAAVVIEQQVRVPRGDGSLHKGRSSTHRGTREYPVSTNEYPCEYYSEPARLLPVKSVAVAALPELAARTTQTAQHGASNVQHCSATTATTCGSGTQQHNDGWLAGLLHAYRPTQHACCTRTVRHTMDTSRHARCTMRPTGVQQRWQLPPHIHRPPSSAQQADAP